MHWRLDLDGPTLAQTLLVDEGLDVAGCDGCAACSAVCPVGDSFDHLPHQIVRQVQLNCSDRALRSSAVWLCTDCAACTAACPRGIPVAAVLAELRRRARRRRLDPPPDAEGVKASQEALIEELTGTGRVSDARVAISYKLRSGDLFTDLALGASLWVSGRLKLIPARGGEGVPEAVLLALERERWRAEDETQRRALRKEAEARQSRAGAAPPAPAQRSGAAPDGPAPDGPAPGPAGGAVDCRGGGETP
ncbi:MAG: 4Fe-4S dicluster domain-containing protein [Candidatus Riflebacteria bacterium]|nr:4Fe-4S dicluster domain-containing protein [Candidatus Riflebacteria bacterium]